MKRNLGSLGLLFSALLLLASCLNDGNEETVLYSDAAITAFQITTANIYHHTTSSSGEDSVYMTTNTGMSAYMFDIDQSTGRISNTDSLPVGTDASALLCSYTSKNNGIAAIKAVGSDSIKLLLTTDSTDFTTPRTVYVYSSDGAYVRTYTIEVNVHKEYADSFHWDRLPDNAALAALTGIKAFSVGGKVVALGTDGQETVVCSTADGSTWARAAAGLGADAWKSAALKGDTLFIIDNNSLKYTTDGNAFTTVAGAGGLLLVGATADELYAYDGTGGIVVSADGGHSWTSDSIDDDRTLLPTADVASCCVAFAHSDSADYALMAGSRAGYDHSGSREDSLYMDKAVVWRKIVERSAIKEQGKWTFLCPESGCGYPLPRLSSLNVFGYDGNIMAFGGAGTGTCDNEAYGSFYASADGGITWKRDSRYNVPSAFDRTAPAVAATVSGDGHIWLVCGGTGQVWRGRLNKTGWQK